MDTRPLIASQGSIGGQDPFYAFKGELDTRVKQTRQKFNIWDKLLKTTNTATNREFKKVNRSLIRSQSIISSLSCIFSIASLTAPLASSLQVRQFHLSNSVVHRPPGKTDSMCWRKWSLTRNSAGVEITQWKRLRQQFHQSAQTRTVRAVTTIRVMVLHGTSCFCYQMRTYDDMALTLRISAARLHAILQCRAISL